MCCDEGNPGLAGTSVAFVDYLKDISCLVREGTMGKAWLVVRSVVPETVRREFDAWYRTEHLPHAVKAFAALRGWRGWSRTDPSVHYAYYEFADVAAAEAIGSSLAIGRLIAEFDARWGTIVTRVREVIEVADERLG